MAALSSILIRSFLLGLLLVASQAAVADDAAPRRLNLDGRVLAIPLPPGYCPADRSLPVIDKMFSMIEKALPKNIRMLALDFGCSWVEVASSGKSPGYPRYVAHIASLSPDGRVATFPGRRDEFLESVVASLASAAGRQAVEMAHAEAERQVLEELNRLADGPVSLEDVQVEPGLASDAAGVYTGVVAKIENRGIVMPLACVSSITLIGGVVVSLNFCREHGGSGTFEELLAEAQAFTAGLVEANDPRL